MGIPHAHLVEAVFKHMAPSHSNPEAAVASVIIAGSMDASAEVGALVVKLYQTWHLEQGLQGPLQQACIGTQQRVQQPPVLVSKPAMQIMHELP